MWCFQVSTNSLVFLRVNVGGKQTDPWLTTALHPVLLGFILTKSCGLQTKKQGKVQL